MGAGALIRRGQTSQRSPSAVLRNRTGAVTYLKSPISPCGVKTVDRGQLTLVEDRPRRCEVIASEARARFGLPVVFGFVLIGDQAIAHYFNLGPGGQPLDAALARRRPTGYIGKRLSDQEADLIGRASVLSAVG